MYYKRTTQLPNDIIDIHLKELNESMLKILLVIIRQTIGYIDTKKGTRKRTDWITIGYFQKVTGLSRKTITKAITLLQSKQLIITFDTRRNEIKTAKERQGKKKLFYAYKPLYLEQLKRTCVQSSINMSTYRPITKLIPTKEIKRKISDRERILQIIKEQDIKLNSRQ